MPALGNQVGDWVEYTLSKPVTFDHLNLQVVTDGEHSIPASITVSTSSGSRTVQLPSIDPGVGRPQGSVTPVQVNFPALTGSNVRITINSIRAHTFLDYYSYAPNTDPVGLAEVGIPGVAPVTTPTQMPVQCYSNLLTIDGKPVDISVSGSTSTALSNGGLTIRGCGNAAAGITLGPGLHTVQTSGYQAAGLNIDALSMGSAAGGAAQPLTSSGLQTAPTAPTTGQQSPSVTVLHQNRTSMTVSVKGNGTPFWMVLGQSQSRGWTATTSSGAKLGSSTLIDGYANGWYVPGSLATGPITITLTWTPQHVVDVALIASGATLLLSLVLIALPARARRRRRRGSVASSSPELSSLLKGDGPAPRWFTSIVIAVIAGVAAGLFVAPLAGLLVAAVTLLELRVERSRVLVLAGALGLLIAMAVYVVVSQHANGFVSDINWPTHFGVANSLVWIAIFLFAADALAQWARARERAGQDGAATPSDSAGSSGSSGSAGTEDSVGVGDSNDS